MADRVTFKVSKAAAPHLRTDSPKEARLQAAAGRVELPPADLLLVVFCLCHDADPEVKLTAVTWLKGLQAEFLFPLLSDPGLHPRILDALVQLHFDKPRLTPLFVVHPMLSEKAAAFLRLKGVDAAGHPTAAAPGAGGEGAVSYGAEGAGDDLPGAGESLRLGGESRHRDSSQALAATDEEGPAVPALSEAPVDEESEQFRSKYQLSQSMGVAEKIKAALTGDKEWRSILIKDSNKLVSSSVVKNPRITDGEVLTISKSAVQNEEVMRVICANKEWVKNPLIRKALAENNKTPVAAALRFVASLSEKDLAMLARNRNVASVISSQARRMLMTKRDGR